MYRRDLESLFWSVFLVWLQVLKKRDSPGRFVLSRRTELSVLGGREGILLDDGTDEKLCTPKSYILKLYLVGQAKSKKLQNPSEVSQSYYIDGMSCEQFNRVALENGFLRCPQNIFHWSLTIYD